jgi:hypothetical protein
VNANSAPAGLASSALGVRRGLAIEWGCGLYFSGSRLIVTKELVSTHFGQDANGAALLGAFSMKLDTFLDRKPKILEELVKSTKKLDVDRSEIVSTQLKIPGVFQGGIVEFKFRSGKSFKLSIADQSIAYSAETFAAIKEIVSTNLSVKEN